MVMGLYFILLFFFYMFIKGVILMRCVAKKLAVVLYGARILSFIVFLLCMSLVNVVVMAQGTSTVNLDDVDRKSTRLNSSHRL